MSSLEMNKIAAAVLTAGVVAMTSGFVAQLLTRPHEVHENAYIVTPAESDAATEMASEEAGPESILPLLASANAEEGAKVARKCGACHTFDKGGANKIGPNLWNVVGRDVASVEGFAYSGALEGIEGDWTYETLNEFIAQPKDFAAGTKMSFAGIKKADDRANLIVYLRDQSDSPMALPSAEEVAAAEPAEAMEAAAEGGAAAEAPAEAEAPAATQEAAAGGEVLALLAGADEGEGEKVFRKCKACHSNEEGAAHKIGPNLYGVVNRPLASAEGYNYSQAMQDNKSKKWTYEHLAQYLERPKDFVPGNKMAFAGIRKPKDRAAVIKYLRSLSAEPAPLP